VWGMCVDHVGRRHCPDHLRLLGRGCGCL